MKIIARIYNDFTEKFGVPRQSGLVPSLESRLIMEPPYRSAEAFRGIEGYSHLWLIWCFSENREQPFRATVRPPRLGGNRRLGVFATRSPFRPNRLGLSCVELKSVRQDETLGPVLTVSGADLMNGTPIYDIKPYLPYADAHPEASMPEALKRPLLSVVIPENIKKSLPADKLPAIREMLEQDPRPAYQDDPERIYGIRFGSWDLHFQVQGGVLTLRDISG